MAGFFGYVGSVAGASALNLRAVTRALLRRGLRTRSTEDRDVDGRFATVLIECDDDTGRVWLDEEPPRPLLAPVLLFDGPRRDLMSTRLAGVRDVDSFVTRELDVGSIGGGFAFAIWGRRHRTLALGCDAAGLRPVYFSGSENGFAFSTEVGALLASDLVRRQVSAESLRAYLRDGGLPDGCLVDGVRRLRPGCYVIVRPFTSSTGRLKCSSEPGDADTAFAEMRETVAAQISPGDPAVLVTRVGARSCDLFLDAVRQAGAGSIVKLAFSRQESVGLEDVVDHRVDLSRLDPVFVLDGVLSSWDQPIADGIFEWLSAAEARRLGSRLLLCDLGVEEPRTVNPLSLVERTLKRGVSAERRPMFDDRDCAKLVRSRISPTGDREPAPRHRIEIASLAQMAGAHSVGYCIPGMGGARWSERSTRTPSAHPVPSLATIRHWILDFYGEQARDALQALAETGIMNSEALQTFWSRFRFDVEPATTSRAWSLITLGAWVRRHDISGMAV